jgi:hypothetical protein
VTNAARAKANFSRGEEETETGKQGNKATECLLTSGS